MNAPHTTQHTTVPDNVQTLEHNGMRWISIEHIDQDAIGYLKEHFNFHALDYEDITSVTHRSKIDKYQDYLFFVLLLPVYNRKTRQIESAEIDFFLGKDYLITIHRGDIPTFIDMFQLCEASDAAADDLMKGSPQFLLYKILQRMFQYCYPIMDHIDLEINEIEKSIFQTGERGLVEEILFVRQNIIDMRKIVQPHHAALTRLKRRSNEPDEQSSFQLADDYDDYYDDVLDYAQEIWDQLETFKESVDALHETNQTLISFRINEVMKTLTVFSVIMLPASVVAGLFGVNAKHIPFVGQPQDFYIITAITLSAILAMLLYIRSKKMF